MRNRHATDIASNLMLAINNIVLDSLPEVEIECAINKIGFDDCSILLNMRQEGSWLEFAQVLVGVYEGDSVLSFEVYAELEVQDHLNRSKMERVRIEDLMQRYANYNPVISEGMLHTRNPTKMNGDGEKNRTTRYVKIKFEIFDRDLKAREDGIYDYDLAEIAEKAVPPLKALYEIHKDVHSGLVEKNDCFD